MDKPAFIVYNTVDKQVASDHLKLKTMQETNPVRVSVSEAARLFGLSQRTIRRAIKNEEIMYIVVQGRYKINFGSLVRWSQLRPITRNKLNNNGIGQFIDKWKISNQLYSPNPPVPQKAEEESVIA